MKVLLVIFCYYLGGLEKNRMKNQKVAKEERKVLALLREKELVRNLKAAKGKGKAWEM